VISYSFLKCFKSMYNLDILDFASFRTYNKPLRKMNYLTVNVLFGRTEPEFVKNLTHILYGFVAHGMSHLLTSGSLTPCQSSARNCLLIFLQ